MPRRREEVPKRVLQKAKVLEKKWSLANELSALIFRRDNLKLISFMATGQELGGLPFSRIGDLSGLGTSQKLVDTLNYMVDYGLVAKANGGYKLTKLGLGTAAFAGRLLNLLSNEERRYPWVKELLEAQAEGQSAAQKETAKFRVVKQQSTAEDL